MKHLRYLRYVALHKWFVLLAGLKLGVPVHQLIVHDWHKLTPTEWFPYVETFYGERTDSVREAFDYAWLAHQKRGKHHWQYWVLPLDDGGFRALEMPDRYRREMLADWHGAGRAINGLVPNGTRDWYRANRDNMVLHPETRVWIERNI